MALRCRPQRMRSEGSRCGGGANWLDFPVVDKKTLQMGYSRMPHKARLNDVYGVPPFASQEENKVCASSNANTIILEGDDPESTTIFNTRWMTVCSSTTPTNHWSRHAGVGFKKKMQDTF